MNENTQKNTDPETHASPSDFIGGSADARAHRRRSVLWPACLKVGQHDFSCQIWNMSLGGARIKIDIPIKDGADVVLTIAGRGDLPAKVCWSETGVAGLEFQMSTDEVRVLFMDRLQSLGFDAPAA